MSCNETKIFITYKQMGISGHHSAIIFIKLCLLWKVFLYHHKKLDKNCFSYFQNSLQTCWHSRHNEISGIIYFHKLLLSWFTNQPFNTFWDLQVFSQSSGIRLSVRLCSYGWAVEKAFAIIQCVVFYCYGSFLHSHTAAQTGLPLTAPYPGVPSGPVLLFGRDLLGDKVIF